MIRETIPKKGFKLNSEPSIADKMDQLPYFSFFRHKKIKKIFSNFRHPTLFSFDSLRQEVNSVFIKSVPSWENRHITSVGRDRSFVCIYLGAHNVDGSS